MINTMLLNVLQKRRGKNGEYRVTHFDQITSSPEALAEYLSNISTMPVCEIIVD